MSRRLAVVALVLCGCHGASGGAADATTGDAADVDAPPEVDASVDADPATAPIVASPDEWTWIDFAASRCASGTPTGLGINPHAGSTDLVIYLQGGGQCTTGATCWGTSPTATFLDGYGADEFARFGPPAFALLDRASSANPLRAANMVFVPYCTGDLHAGTREIDLQAGGMTKPTYFWGGSDLDVFLKRLAPTFPDVRHVWLVGASAGGFGTFLSFDRVARAFGSARVDILDDSGPPILASGATHNGDLAYWGYETPSSCAAPCDTYAAVVTAARQQQPSSRIGYLLFAEDSTLWSRFHYPTIEDYAGAIDAFTAGLSDPNQAAFVVRNEQAHVVESDHSLDAQDLPWIQAMVTDDPAWASASYTHP